MVTHFAPAHWSQTALLQLFGVVSQTHRPKTFEWALVRKRVFRLRTSLFGIERKGTARVGDTDTAEPRTG